MNRTPPNFTRRRFVLGTTAVSTGLAVGLQFNTIISDAKAAAGKSVQVQEVGAWVVIQENDDVIIRVVRSEMGQGTITGLAQLVAEELECEWEKISIEYPSPGESLRRKGIWGSFSTGGSRGIRTSEDYVRRGGAVARFMLVQAAANHWGVAPAACSVSRGIITHQPSARTLRFGQVAGAASKLPIPDSKSVVLKDPSAWKIIGKPMRRLDRPEDKVTGRQIYAIDLMLPGMLVATIKECPVFGGKLSSFDASKVKQLPGLRQVLQVGDTAVAVVAETFWQAKTAIDQLPIVWDEGPNADINQSDILKRLESGLQAQQVFVGNENGNFNEAINKAHSVIESKFFYPFLNHAPMEPMNATAIWSERECRAWVPTQDGEASLAAVIAASGLSADKCDVIKMNLGGGFGRRGAFQDYTTQVVNIAKQMPGVPIKLIWTREEDMTQGRYHPIMMCKMTGSFDEGKSLTGVHMRLSGQSILASVRPAVLAQNKGMDPLVFQGVAKGGEHGISYDFPNLLIDHAMRNSHVPPGFWRGVNINQNAVFMECFVDELAEFSGIDPLEFRRKYSANHPRNLAVLDAVAGRIEWSKPPPTGVFRGIAQQHSFGSWVAAACELSVQHGGEVKIHRIVAATDPGYAVNPAQIERQVSGSFVYGLSALFEEECTVNGGRIEQKNFDTFGSIRLAQMPRVETIIIQGGGREWGGVGEPTISVAAPAVLNAIYKATGKRIRSIPIKHSGMTLV